MHWHFNLVLNASVMVVRAAIRVYMFHSRELHAPVMGLLFRPYQPYDDITLDDIHPYFLPPRYLTDGESDFDTRLTLMVSLDFDPSEPSYLSYHVESDPSEPSHPSVICLTSDSSSSSVAPHHVLPGFVVKDSSAPVLYPMDVGMAEEEDMVMMLPVVLGVVTPLSMVDKDSACGAKHEDNPFWLVVIGLSFTFGMCRWMGFLMYFFYDVIG